MPEPERLHLGRYALGEKLGEGGMGVVYRARADGAEGFAKAVAIKTIHGNLARDPGIREMFVSEARTAQRLQHGNVVQIIDVGTADGAPYLVIELVEGASLADLMRANGRRPLPIADALFVAESVASALAYAHGLTDKAGRADGVVHRDVTPRNILVSHDGVVKLADFGIAKALAAPSYTVPGTFKGSIGYLAPEQARGETVDARADQFAFGVVLHEMLAGKTPLAARDIEAYLAVLDAGVPPVNGVDEALAAIVARATAIDPSARYPSMDELRGELEAWRVAQKIRTSTESLRATMRAALGDGATVPTGIAFGDALAGVLGPETSATKLQSPRALAARRTRWQWPAVVLGVVAIVFVAYAIGSRSAGVGSSAPPVQDASDRPVVVVENKGSAARNDPSSATEPLGGSSDAPQRKPVGSGSDDARRPVASGDERKPVDSGGGGERKPIRGGDAVDRKPVDSGGAGERKPIRGGDAVERKPIDSGGAGERKPIRGSDVVERKPVDSGGGERKSIGNGSDNARKPVDSGGGRKPVPGTAKLRVNVVPWARVVIDGRPRGGVPLTIELPAGKHSLVLENDSGDRVEKEIVIEAGRDQAVTAW